MIPITEKQAWLFIAKEFEKKHRTRFNRLGLCLAIDELECFNRISFEVFHSMNSKIHRKMSKQGNGYCLWPLTESNKPKRAKLARRFAKECEG